MSKRADAAYPLISDRLKHYSDKLLTSHISTCNYWIHESVVARFIELPTNEVHGQSESLTALLNCIKVGYGGNRRKGTNVSTTHDPVDLQDEHNPSRVCYQQWGSKQPFERGALQQEPVNRRTRWFWFGDRTNKIELGVQLDILNEIIGKRVSLELTDHDPTRLVPIYAAKRRKRLHKLFYKKQLSECQPYLNYDVPAIAFKYMDVLWPNIEMNSTNIRRRSFNPSDL